MGQEPPQERLQRPPQPDFADQGHDEQQDQGGAGQDDGGIQAMTSKCVIETIREWLAGRMTASYQAADAHSPASRLSVVSRSTGSSRSQRVN